jgi:ATP-dependent helicase HrpB
MAGMLGEAVGQTVGYVTRDERRVGEQTRIEVVTEGVLTRRLQRDPSLRGTGLLIFDEFHERNLQTDLGLALALDSINRLRPDLRLIVMSATLDAKRVGGLIEGPVIAGEPSGHPVEIRWVPPSRQVRPPDHVAAVVRRAMTDPGDLLVFLPGMAEMRKVRGLVEGIDAEVHLLHGSLAVEAQDAALLPSGRRKVVLATDIAETSLTVEGVGVVIDSGLARAPRFDPHTGMTRLRTITISRAAADQRTGRAGRTGPGIAYRLWSQLEHGTRRAQIDPEITQVDLAGLALELAAWGTTDASGLQFLDPPPGRALAEGRNLLLMLGAIDEAGHPTAPGREMLRLPLHPRLARMVLTCPDADRWLACVLATVIDERDPLLAGSDPADPSRQPADLALRVKVVAGAPGLDRFGRRARDLARRAGTSPGSLDPGRAGRIVALAFPDRLAIRRGSPGRFQLRTGTTAYLPATDPLATAGFLIAADLDGERKDARIRLAAPLDPDEVAERFAGEVVTRVGLVWQGDRLVERTERRLGGLGLDVIDRAPQPGPAVAAELAARIRKRGWASLDPDDRTRSLRERVTFVRRHLDPTWPDWSDQGLLDSLEDWLGGQLLLATGLDQLRPAKALVIPRGRGDLDQLAPLQLGLPGGRRVAVSYGDDGPRISLRAQDLFGLDQHPRIADSPVVIEILSPANRPIQITSDLPAFWRGTWRQVRKEMQARYPKHSWPEQPFA